MKEIIKRLTYKATFISIISTIIILVSIPIGIYLFVYGEPSTEGWVLVMNLYLYIFIGFALSLDRALVKYIKPSSLSIVEILLLGLYITYSSYSDRQLTLDLSDSNQDFVLIVENNGELVESPMTDISFFDKKIKTNKELIVMNDIPDKIFIFDRPKSWNGGHSELEFKFDKYEKVLLFYGDDSISKTQITEQFVDSLILK